MQYKIIVDKQSRTNPSADKKEYIIETEELRTNGKISDSMVITKDEDYILRKLKLNEYHVLEVLDEPIKESLDENIELFDGDNYIYLIDMIGNKFYAEYIIKNDLTEMYATKVELTTAINETANEIRLLASKKLDKDEFSTMLEVNAEAVKVAWNKITEYLQMEVINKNASLAVRDEAKNLLMSLDKLGQHFFNGKKSIDIGAFDCYFPSYGENYKSLMFALNDSDKNNFMAWGYKTTLEDGTITYTPIIFLGGKSDEDYGFHVDSPLFIGFNEIVFKKSKIYDDNSNLVIESEENLLIKDKIDNSTIFSIYKNSTGTRTYKFGNIDKPVLITDNGELLLAGGNIFLDKNGYIDCIGLNQTSVAEKKKNFEKLENALDIIDSIDIYKYNFKTENDTDKKHIGFVIGDEYKYSKEVTSIKNDGADIYALASVCVQSIKEIEKDRAKYKKIIKKQQEQLDNQNKRIEELESKVEALTKGVDK